MLFCVRDDGIASAVIPKPGQTVEECICEQLEIQGRDEMEVFNPTMLNIRLNNPDLAMIGRVAHRPGEGENMVGNILTGKPEREWCYGPMVIVRRYGNDFVGLSSDHGFVGNVIQKLSGIVLKDLPFTVPGKGESNA